MRRLSCANIVSNLGSILFFIFHDLSSQFRVNNQRKSNLKATMNLANQKTDINKQADIDELKRPLHYREDEDGLCEWESARLKSKTWSMEQE